MAITTLALSLIVRMESGMLSAAKQIKVRGSDVSGVELVVQPLSSVTGRVVLEETKTTECSDKQRPVFTETLVSAQSSE